MAFLPKREADLLMWSAGMSTKLSADPAAFGLTIEQAADYAALHAAFAAAFTLASDPGTRTRPAVQAKNDAKAALIDAARAVVRMIQAYPGATNRMRAGLGITVPDTELTPVPRPSRAPGLRVVSAISRTVTLRLKDTENPDRRGKPDGVDGALVFSYLGSRPPAPEDTGGWKFEGITGRTSISVLFPPAVESGATAWFTARWFSARKESGPVAQPISAQIPATLPHAA